MQEIITLGDVPVEILYYGGISPSEMLKKPVHQRPKDLVLFIPGMPGIVQQYARFSEQLYRNLKIPVWSIGYGGLSRKVYLPLKPRYNQQLYGMRAQVRQKKELVFEYLEGVTICLVAHSYACALTLDCMTDQQFTDRINKVYLLFPMFQDFYELPVVFKLDRILGIVRSFLIHAEPVAVQIFKSSWVRTLIYKGIVYLMGWPNTDNFYELIHVDTLWSFFWNTDDCGQFLSGKPYNDVLMMNVKKIIMWVSEGDMWQTKDFYESIKREVPGLNIEYQPGIPHTYHFTHNGKTADLLSDEILLNIHT